ncbi:hypothetical protein A9Q98_08525 [Thalassotalea sp. 42_200_T64]|nr:hypothetical protein A9Q98_08525 [Thalassotalea sp. 42_200_T64]
MNQNIENELEALYQLIRQESQDEVRIEMLQLQADMDKQIEGLQIQIGKYKAVESKFLSKCQKCESKKVSSLTEKLEETVTSKNVLNHHCANLKNYNIGLNDLYDDKSNEFNELTSKYVKQAQALVELTKRYKELVKQKKSADQTIKRYEADLSLFKDNYYSDVMNQSKSVSTNLPKKNSE